MLSNLWAVSEHACGLMCGHNIAQVKWYKLPKGNTGMLGNLSHSTLRHAIDHCRVMDNIKFNTKIDVI